MDVDRVVNVKLDVLFGENTKMCLPTSYDENFMQDLMSSSANNNLYLETIKAQSQKRLAGGRSGGALERRGGWATTAALFDMGPPAYNKMISRLVFDKDGIISKDDIPKARSALEATNGVIITKRDEWCNGFLVTPCDGSKKVNRNRVVFKVWVDGVALAPSRPRWRDKTE